MKTVKTKMYIESFKDIHQDKTVFILGNGPSLNDYDLSKLAHVPTISMNRGYTKFVGGYYVTLMDTFYLGKVVGKSYDTIFTVGSPAEVPQDISWKIGADLIFIRRLTKRDKPLSNPFDLTQGWRVTHTGIFALFLAQWMGFANAVLLGYDGVGKHFMPRVQADDVPKHEQHKKEMREFMLHEGRELHVYNCFKYNTYQQGWIDFEDALEILK